MLVRSTFLQRAKGWESVPDPAGSSLLPINTGCWMRKFFFFFVALQTSLLNLPCFSSAAVETCDN